MTNETQTVASTQTKTHKPFYEMLPDGRMLFRIDNYRMQTFSRCGVLFDYTQIQNYRGKKRGTALSIGIWWARVLELFYTELSYGALPTLDQMLKFIHDAWTEENMGEIGDRFTIDHALLMVADYYYKFAEHDYRDWRIIGAEVGFGMNDEIKIAENNEVVVYLTGRPDLVIYESSTNKVKIVDHKTVDYIKSDTLIKFKPHPQTAGYIIAARYLAQHAGYPRSELTDSCIINIAGRNPPAEKPRDGVLKPRYMRAKPHYNPEELDEYRVQVLRKCSAIKHSILTNEWERRESSCHLYGGCMMRGVCSIPPSSRHIALAADFVKTEPWQPYEIEED